MKYYSAINKNKIMSFVATWIVILSKGRQIEKNKYYHLYVESKKECYK